MHHISKNWERVFDFQYKVVIGQCVPNINWHEHMAEEQYGVQYENSIDSIHPPFVDLSKPAITSSNNCGASASFLPCCRIRKMRNSFYSVKSVIAEETETSFCQL